MKMTTLITKDRAIEIAEEFVVRNGYTQAKVHNTDGQQPESIERKFDRFNTLQPEAVSARLTDGVWTIGFAYTDDVRKEYPQIAENVGRAVTMNEEGNDVKIQHQDIFLESLK